MLLINILNKQIYLFDASQIIGDGIKIILVKKNDLFSFDKDYFFLNFNQKHLKDAERLSPKNKSALQFFNWFLPSFNVGRLIALKNIIKLVF